MLKKLGNAILGMSLAFVSILPVQYVNSLVKAEEKFIIVDDTQTDNKQEHYFTYEGGNGNGENGWSDSDANYGQGPLKTQHWVWNDKSVEEAAKYTYTFTFKGTGVDLVGITPTGSSKNSFQLDGKNIQTENMDTSSAKKESVLYKVRNLDYATHTVNVTLPKENGQKGLQVSYAKVYGAVEDPNKPQNLESVINPTVQEGVNSFKFVGTANNPWHVDVNEAYIDYGNGSSEATNSYYEVNFVGNKIAIEAAKSHNHGKVKFTIDGKDEKIVDLYASNRKTEIVCTFENLDETNHVLRAQTLNEKNSASTSKVVNQVYKAHIYHAPYVLKSLEVETPVNMIEESEHKLDVKLTPVYANPENMKFESKNTDIATVNDKGVITAKKAGETEIHVSAKGVETQIAKVVVKEQIKAMGGSIVDENLQWTQTKREEVSKMGTTSKNLTAWQADTAVAEFVVYAKQSSLKNVSLSVSDFTNGKNTISKDNVSATFVKSTKAYQGMPGWNNHPENYPIENETNRDESSDIIYTKNPVNISYDKVQPVWVEVNVPKGTPAGVYTGNVTVSTNDLGKDKDLTFTFNVRVQDVELPDVSTYGNSFDIELWQYPYSSAEYYNMEPFSPEHLEVLKSNMSLYKKIGGHAITATISEDAWEGQTYSTKNVHYPSMVTWKLVEGKFTGNKISDHFKFEYDFSDFDAWVQLNKDLGIGDKIVLYSIAPWHGSFTYYVGDTLHKTKYVAGDDTYNRVWGDFFRAMVDHLDEKGWFDDAYVGIDERLLTAKAFDLIDTVKNKDGKSLKTCGAMDSITKDDHPALARRITELTIGDNIVQDPKMKPHFEQLLKERNEKGFKTTLYSCTGHIPGNFSLSAPAESYWSMMFAYKNGTSGFLRWAYDAWVKDPLEDATHSSFETGDCFLVYPDRKDAKNPTTKSSLRLEKMAQGIRDINKLIMMSNEYPELKADVDALLNNVKTTYEHTKYFLTDAGKLEVAKDMNAVHDGIDAITEKYIALRDKDDIVSAKEDLAELLETAKPNLDKADEFTKESFDAFKEAYDNGEKLLKDDKATLSELRNAITTLQEKMEGLTKKEEINPTPDPDNSQPWEELTPSKPIEKPVGPEENNSTQGQPEKPNNDKVENTEKPNTGVSTNTVLLWTVVLGAGVAVTLLANKKRKIQR